MKKPVRILKKRLAGPDHQVITLKGGSNKAYRREPCPTCPWRVDAVGEFPAEAFCHSANTAEDMSTHVFACHQAGAKAPATCAGFLLSRNADDNLAVRLAKRDGRIKDDVSPKGLTMFPDYYTMAVANGVAPDDPALAVCRRYK